MQRSTFALATMALVGYVVWRDWQRENEPGAVEPDFIDQAQNTLGVITDGVLFDTQDIDMSQASSNTSAFLQMIRVAEGTDGPNGYRTLFGGSTFSDYSDHPRQRITAMSNGKPITSTAAGAYQFLSRTWDALATKLGLTDFSPQNQDTGAVELIREAGALADVQAGRFATAVRKVRNIWASLPGAGYGQPERALSTLQVAYVAAGGVVNG